MKVTNLKHESSSVNNIVLNSDGSVGGELATTLASKLDLAGGKILQIVRATDGTNRGTTSTSYVDITGMSVTITPQKSDSAIIVIAAFRGAVLGTQDNLAGSTIITDSSNNALGGAENPELVVAGYTGTSTRVLVIPFLLIGYSTPATTSATTYKIRGKVTSGTTLAFDNAAVSAQLYAIEVSA